MTSHLLVRAVDPELPATLSPAVLALLRNDLGFDGVIVSDALDMAGASAGRGIPEAAVLALAAGADLLCLGADKDPGLVSDIQRAVVSAVESGRLDEARLVDAAARVTGLASRRTSKPAAASSSDVQLAAARRAIRVEGELPSLAGACVVQVATPANIAVGAVPWGLKPDVTVAPDDPGPGGPGPLVVQVRDAHRQPAVQSFLSRIPADRPVVVLEWGWPAPEPGGRPRVMPHGSSRPAIAAVTELLSAAGWHR
jgi:beta-N-acetylhexosaminidase